MSTTDDMLNGATTIGAGAYLIAVVYRGNTTQFLHLIATEKKYIDFIVALFIIGAIQKYGPTSKIANTLTAITLIGLAIKVGSKVGFNDAITNFANGKAGIFETVYSIVTGKSNG